MRFIKGTINFIIEFIEDMLNIKLPRLGDNVIYFDEYAKKLVKLGEKDM